MTPQTPFEALLELHALEPFLRAQGRRTHAIFRDLIGSARPLAAAALGLAHTSQMGVTKQTRASTKSPAAPVPGSGTRVVLYIVDGPEAALDVAADLRAFLASEEAIQTARRVPARKLTDEERYLKNLNHEERWADAERPAEDSMPEHLLQGLRLESALFPAWDVLPTESDRPEGLTLAGRRKATERLREIKAGRNAPPQCLFFIAPVTALLQPTESPSDTGKQIVLKKNDEHDPIKLARALAESGYDRVGQVEVRGEFALRGGILDIFPYTSDTPYRVDFFGENIESIKPFDPLSQRSEEEVESIEFADASPGALKKLF